MINYTSNGKVVIIHLIAGLIKEIQLYKNELFPPYCNSENDIKDGLYLSNYATKSDFKNATGVYTPQFAKKVDLAGVKSKVDKLDIGKLETTPVDLSKISYIVRNEVVKKTEYDELIKKVHSIHTADTSNLV